MKTPLTRPYKRSARDARSAEFSPTKLPWNDYHPPSSGVEPGDFGVQVHQILKPAPNTTPPEGPSIDTKSEIWSSTTSQIRPKPNAELPVRRSARAHSPSPRRESNTFWKQDVPVYTWKPRHY